MTTPPGFRPAPEPAIDRSEVIDRQSRRFAESVASYLMVPDKVNPGVVKDLHY